MSTRERIIEEALTLFALAEQEELCLQGKES